MVRKAKLSKRRRECIVNVREETVRRMEVELEEKGGAGCVIVEEIQKKICLMMVSGGVLGVADALQGMLGY